jgi:hypothetical protein
MYAVAAGMLLHINRKLTMGKLKWSLIQAREPPVQNMCRLEGALHREWQQLSQQDIRCLTVGMRCQGWGRHPSTWGLSRVPGCSIAYCAGKLFFSSKNLINLEIYVCGCCWNVATYKLSSSDSQVTKFTFTYNLFLEPQIHGRFDPLSSKLTVRVD